MGRTYLQEIALRQAKKQGLPQEIYDQLVKYRCNFHQIEVVNAYHLEHPDLQIHPLFYQRKLNIQEMNDVLGLSLDQQKEILRSYPIRVLRHGGLWLKGVLGVMMVLLMVGWTHRSNPLYIHLKFDQVTLSLGQNFDPALYVASYSEQGELLLPESFTAASVETRLVKYVLIDRGQSVEAYLRVEIVDDIAPVLKLKTDYVELLPEDTFDCMDYVSQAYDESDGDLKKTVGCHLKETSAQETLVTYYVEDRYQNKSTASLVVHRMTLQEMVEQLEQMRKAYEADQEEM